MKSILFCKMLAPRIAYASACMYVHVCVPGLVVKYIFFMMSYGPNNLENTGLDEMMEDLETTKYL